MSVAPVERLRCYVGIDLGKVKDPAAPCVMERREIFRPGPHLPHDARSGATETSYRIRHLERLALGTSYPAVVERVAAIGEKLRLLHGRPPELIVDVTGVGRPVFDLLRDRGHPAVGVNFTAGGRARYRDGVYNVPKKDLVGGLVLLFQSRELRIAEGLRDAAVLVNFREFLSAAGHASYANDGHEAKHDDYESAAALCAWRARLRVRMQLGQSRPLLA
jgi:hypothetical protein